MSNDRVEHFTQSQKDQLQADVVTGSFSKNQRASNPNVAIILMNEKGDTVRTWNLVRPFPVKWVGPDFKASGNEVAIESLEIAHEGIKVT